MDILQNFLDSACRPLQRRGCGGFSLNGQRAFTCFRGLGWASTCRQVRAEFTVWRGAPAAAGALSLHLKRSAVRLPARALSPRLRLS